MEANRFKRARRTILSWVLPVPFIVLMLVFADNISKTSVGKFDKKVLRDEFANRS